MASRLLCQRQAAVLAQRQMYRPTILQGRYARRLLSTSAAACKTGREWDYIDGPIAPPAPNSKPGKKLATQRTSSGSDSVPPDTRSGAPYGDTGSSAGNGAHSSVSNSSASPSSQVPPSQQAPPNGMEPISPKMIMRYLDEYVIGQERAKKTLAVAVYNHYNRVRANALRRQREQLSAAVAAASATAPGSPSHTSSPYGSSVANQPHTYTEDTSDRQPQDAGRNGTGSAYPTHQYPFVNRPWNGAFDNSSLFIRESEISAPPPPPPPSSLDSAVSRRTDTPQKSQNKSRQQQQQLPALPSSVDIDVLETQLEKSNVLLLGPTGSGKTLLAKTLAQILDVPFSVSDATPLTQAGYVGEDVEVVIQRLMQSCDYDVARAEQGIVFIDEIDKIARKPDSFSMSKDVSGEGVQQGLLRMLEGTIVTVTDKTGHGSSGSGHSGSPPSPFPPQGMGSGSQPPPPGLAPNSLGVGGPLRRGGPLSGTFGPGGSGGGGGPSSAGGHGGLGGGMNGPLGSGKGEVYHVDTSNILFILSGAFVGLDRLVMERVAKASIGFGNPVRKVGDTSSPVDLQAMKISPVSFTGSDGSSDTPFNPLDYAEPSDLIKFGLIPEFIGRLPVVTSVGALNKDALVRVLVEPKNALVRQYEALLALSGAQLHITKPALYTIAQQAIDKQTGARGLRRIMENLLLEPMFDCPGSSIRHVVIDSDVAAFKKRPLYFSKIQEADVEAAIWNDEHRGEPSQKRQHQPQHQQPSSAEKKRLSASSA
ncbi:ATP-binding protein [Dipsacomyces acuminosporus]|nr:ATP-binding protein [Dipsacomyces acuminosporus]